MKSLKDFNYLLSLDRRYTKTESEIFRLGRPGFRLGISVSSRAFFFAGLPGLRLGAGVKNGGIVRVWL